MERRPATENAAAFTNANLAQYGAVVFLSTTGDVRTRSLQVRASSGGNGGTLQIRSGSQTGPIMGTAGITNTGGWNNYASFTTATLTGVPASTANVYLTFTGSGSLFDVDQIVFVKS